MTFIQKQALWVSRDANGNINLHFPTTHVAYVEGGVATVNGATPDENKNVTITDITGNAATATTAETCTGNSATATKLKSAISINNVAFDGTKNINIPVGVKTVNGIEPSEDGDVVVAGLPIGTVIAYAANTAPDGYLMCNGAAVSRTTYANLFAKIGTTYGAGNGSTTFTLPNLTDRFIQGSSTAGTTKEAGLPNITGQIADQDGTFGLFGSANVAATGAFSSSNGGKRRGGDGSARYDPRIINFNAQNSSAIYGKSTTVQPPAVTMRYCIKY